MRKIILSLISLIFLLNLFMIVKADILPYYVNSLRRYGIGYTNVKSPLVLRQTPSKEGKILETLTFDFQGNASCLVKKDQCNIDEIFAAYSPSKKIALLTAMDESQDWSLVCFNQTNIPICGWVEENENKFYNWSDFFNIYGKKYGLYLFKDLKKSDKILYGGPMKQTNSVGSIELPRYISPWLIRGNWVMIKVNDLSGPKTGWFNFRGDDGKLKLFVNF